MRVHVAAIVSAVLFSCLLTTQPAHGQCLLLPVQVLNLHENWIVFKGTPSSVTGITDAQRKLRKVIFDVERVWKGSVGERVELYLDLTGEDPQFALGHGDGQYPPFAVGQSTSVVAVVLRDAVQRRLSTGPRTPVYGLVGCAEFSESEITRALGPGKGPRKDATR